MFVSDGCCFFDRNLTEVHDVDACWEHAQRNSLGDLTPLVVPDEHVGIGVDEAEVLVLDTASWWEFGCATFVFFT